MLLHQFLKRVPGGVTAWLSTGQGILLVTPLQTAAV
ncbi:hypothetical protein PFWH6_3343 [Pseudomonas fluorescens WH6]|nr:hypothetical protein PFWH6_3343 [Pseudomonas fluorescens WH6]